MGEKGNTPDTASEREPTGPAGIAVSDPGAPSRLEGKDGGVFGPAGIAVSDPGTPSTKK
jgi:hypothetical protein